VADINDRLPIIPHEKLGADCCGCLVVQLNGDQADIVSNECGAVVHKVAAADVETTLLNLAATTSSAAPDARTAGPRTRFPAWRSSKRLSAQSAGKVSYWADPSSDSLDIWLPAAGAFALGARVPARSHVPIG
jgi:hypothetical protein